jgi:hypothetical protein
LNLNQQSRKQEKENKKNNKGEGLTLPGQPGRSSPGSQPRTSPPTKLSPRPKPAQLTISSREQHAEDGRVHRLFPRSPQRDADGASSPPPLLTTSTSLTVVESILILHAFISIQKPKGFEPIQQTDIAATSWSLAADARRRSRPRQDL